jgi:hypothetical protein
MKTTCLHILATLVLLACVTPLTGCVTRTTVKDETRLNIRFATPDAAQTFYDAYLAINHPSPQKDTCCVYIPLPYRHYNSLTDNVRFNTAIRSADSNQDGIISESEASTYVEKIKKPSA